MNPKQLDRSSRNDAAGVDDRKVLIVALDAVAPAEAPDGELLVVAPALNSRLRHWLSDDDTARRRAGERLTAFIELLDGRGVHAGGRVGDADPLLAIADALVTFPADEIVIAAGSHHSTRFAEQLATRARKRFALSTSHTAEPEPEPEPEPAAGSITPVRIRPTTPPVGRLGRPTTDSERSSGDTTRTTSSS